ncbi:hypothetical protein [Vibrio taketomensis]|uniref:hypothetical protein n=1 Tax=Vibrio taketomensis TaxID=2572923 RepID=UPI00138A00F8|nr:hypothetical protein [Vibrio taketomensis]
MARTKRRENYTFVLEHTTFNHRWLYENTSSPVQIPQILPNGDYRWYVSDSNGLRSQWHHFSINQTSQAYLPPSAKELFELCSNREQFMMYFDEDIQEVKQESWLVYEKFKRTASFTDLDAIQYPNHYRRGKEEANTAIANVRRWIDRDLMSLTLLYKIWGVEDDGQLAVKLLLQLAEWSRKVLHPYFAHVHGEMKLACLFHATYFSLSLVVTAFNRERERICSSNARSYCLSDGRTFSTR